MSKLSVAQQSESPTDVDYVEAPLDLQFKRIASCDEMAEEMVSYFPDHERPSSEIRLITNVVKLNNNSLNNLTGFNSFLSQVLFDPSVLAWLDLSFNNLPTIEKELMGFPNLKMLYMHGNCIKNLEDVDKLSALRYLIKLTLHGNDIASADGYREYVLIHLPNLKMLDFSGVTHSDRSKMRLLASAIERKNRPKRQY